MVNDAQMAPEVYDVVADFGEKFADAWTARQVGPYMTCAEANAVAEVIALTRPDAEQAFLYGHANGEHNGGDSEGDEHYWMRDDYDAAARDADHPATIGEEPDECGDCGQPVFAISGLILHKGLDEVTRQRYRQIRRAL